MSHNISESLSNSLDINMATTPAMSGGNRRLLSDGFPNWLSATDRKLLQSSMINADLVVAKDGSGDYKTISEAIAAAMKQSSGKSRFVIHVKAGVYSENIQTSMKSLMIIGDGMDATVVTGSKNVQDGSTTFRSATFAVTGDGFIARDMTFENTAGPQKNQAVALRSGSDLSVFYRCIFKGYQDMLYVYSQRQFYRNCDIYGTVDFIFGDAAVVLQNCNMYVRKPMSGQKNTVTAQGWTDPNENTGISIHDSAVTAASDLKPVIIDKNLEF
ncbi:putative Pectinesterase 2 [Cocos nucifera]|uniref:Pectinesterase n=1 Tax=Cocos nucifera TaxID=13894 RepID=A0A8K0MY37_COCNU|nr:putative Pectinesterase 2 [Cocos nucifera]